MEYVPVRGKCHGEALVFIGRSSPQETTNQHVYYILWLAIRSHVRPDDLDCPKEADMAVEQANVDDEAKDTKEVARARSAIAQLN